MSHSQSQGGGSLTPRELEVARLVASGMRNRDIAEALQIELTTTKNHVARIMGKLNAQSRMDVMLWVLGRAA
jgi:DNA-binding NarL/FixJ family response regulator